uniref:Hexosyltransferase n=1 Tax=Kalanchoe fedtschenkoi TaxID=63787 RepID=A0A7N0RCT7_KALFE
MKGGGSSYALPAKRRWRRAIGVLLLVLLSMLLPLAFLLGLHNGFLSAGISFDQQSSIFDVLPGVDESDATSTRKEWENDNSERVQYIIQKMGTDNSKDPLTNFGNETENKIVDVVPEEISHQTPGSHAPPDLPKPKTIPAEDNASGDQLDITTETATNAVEESEDSCELKYGSYCIWRREHREEMKDTMVKKLKDLLFVARAYYPSVAKLPGQDNLSHELKQNIQEFEHIFSEAITDADLPNQIEHKVQKMEDAIAKAKAVVADCNNVDKKLQQLVDLTEDEARFHMKQSAYLYQIGVQTMPKSFHCLFMRLTVEYFQSTNDIELPLDEKFMNPSLQHYVLFSKNVLAASVVINSTVMHAKESGNQVFHIFTDRQNYFAMKFWFYQANYQEAAVEVLNIEEIELPDKATLQLYLPEEYRVSVHGLNNSRPTQIKTEYISVFSHSHYFLPDIFHYLKKIVVLDDDVVVQQDLSALWSLDMEGKVNGAVQRCSLRLGQLRRYMGEKYFDEKSCLWMSGLNVIDLVRWREQDITGTYNNLMREPLSANVSSETLPLRSSYLSFQNQLYPLDDKWALSGLGHDYGVNAESVENAAVLHYNGNMKPWLDLGIPSYRSYWKMYLDSENQFLSQCNVNS